jgi:hypothetical protein
VQKHSVQGLEEALKVSGNIRIRIRRRGHRSHELLCRLMSTWGQTWLWPFVPVGNVRQGPAALAQE